MDERTKAVSEQLEQMARERIIAAFSNALDALDVQCDAVDSEDGGDSAWHDAYRIIAQIKDEVLGDEHGFTAKTQREIVAAADEVKREQDSYME